MQVFLWSREGGVQPEFAKRWFQVMQEVFRQTQERDERVMRKAKMACRDACVVLLHDYYRPEHVARVTDQMRRLGPPVLRATALHGRWYLHEGCHRTRSALALGIRPVLVSVPWTWSSRGVEKARHRKCVQCGLPAKGKSHESRANG
jgi:hypothetical protein